MNSKTKAGIDIPDERLRIIIEEEIALTACQPFLKAKTVTSLYDKLPEGTSNLTRFFRKASGGLEIYNPAGFFRSYGLDWYLFALARFDGEPSGFAFAYLKGIHRILSECARQFGALEPTIVDSMVLYFRYRIMERAKKKKKEDMTNFPDPPFVEFEALSFELNSYTFELRTELADPRYELPRIDQAKVEKVVREFYYLWLSVGQALVKEKINAVIF